MHGQQNAKKKTHMTQKFGIRTKNSLHDRFMSLNTSETLGFKFKILPSTKGFHINNCPTRCNTKQSIYYSASSLYMFRVSTTPIIRSIQNYNYSLWYWSYFLCSATSAPHTRPTQRLSRPPPIQKLGAENHMLQLNIWCSWWWACVPEACQAKNTLIKLPCCIKLTFQINSRARCMVKLPSKKPP